MTPDYTAFALWHALQGLSSYARGVLSTHAVLRGVGVGDAAASALGAVFAFFVRDVVGMAGGIAFAATGESFEAYAKQWRLFADVANDVGAAARRVGGECPPFPPLHSTLLLPPNCARLSPNTRVSPQSLYHHPP